MGQSDSAAGYVLADSDTHTVLSCPSRLDSIQLSSVQSCLQACMDVRHRDAGTPVAPELYCGAYVPERLRRYRPT